MPIVPWAVVVLSCAGDPVAEASRAQVLATLDEMTRAVLAGDAGAYLAFIAADDARFAAEHRAWADDLRAHRPTEFGLSAGGASDGPAWAREAFASDRAEFTLVMTYRMEVGHSAALAGGARAAWPAVFVRRDADGDGPGPARWLYAGEQWSVAPGDGFEVRYFPGAEDAVADILLAFPLARAHDHEGFGIDPGEHQVIKLYDDMEHLKASVFLSMPDRVLGGWNEPGESIKFLTRYTAGVPSWTRAMAHEYGHVVTWAIGPMMRETPWWVHEGVAELAAEAFDPDGRRAIDAFIRRLARHGGLVAWDELADYRTARQEIKLLAYKQGHHFMGYVSERWGREGRNLWLAAMGRGLSVDDATREALGLPFADLDAQWRATLPAGGVP